MRPAIPHDLSRCIDFHGHLCPGLIIGYLASEIGMQKMKWQRPEDEERICVVMSDGCAVDAVQYMTGCTLGKGNLIFQDYGKMVFIFLKRKGDERGKGLRLSFRAPSAMKMLRRAQQANREEAARALLASPAGRLFSMRELKDCSIPRRAKIFPSLRCTGCGELTMEPRLTVSNGKLLCQECAPENYSRGW